MKKTTKWILVIVSILVVVGVAFMKGVSVGIREGLVIRALLTSPKDTSRLTADDYTAIWQANGLEPEVYAKTAFSIMKEMGRTNLWLTPGNVIQILGEPSGANVNGYQGTSAPRLDLWFKNDKVFLSFSMLGPLESVQYKVGPQSRTGWGCGISEGFLMPIPKAAWPLFSGVFQNHAPPVLLLSNAEALSKGLKTEAEWYPIIMKHFRDYPPPQTPSGLDIPCESHMMIVDGLGDDLARITFAIKGENEYWCDTWWHLEDGQWVRLSPHEGAKHIAGK
jgi:hypothetical protein